MLRVSLSRSVPHRTSTWVSTKYYLADILSYFIIIIVIIITFIGFGSQVGLITTNIQTYTGWVNR